LVKTSLAVEPPGRDDTELDAERCVDVHVVATALAPATVSVESPTPATAATTVRAPTSLGRRKAPMT
jgi:hypothetical protein